MTPNPLLSSPSVCKWARTPAHPHTHKQARVRMHTHQSTHIPRKQFIFSTAVERQRKHSLLSICAYKSQFAWHRSDSQPPKAPSNLSLETGETHQNFRQAPAGKPPEGNTNMKSGLHPRHSVSTPNSTSWNLRANKTMLCMYLVLTLKRKRQQTTNTKT